LFLPGASKLTPSIGLRSTGIVVFGARILSAITGLAFAVMVARWLPVGQFGLWEYIVTLVSFATYPVGLVGFWATRDVARGRLVGKTAYVLGFALGLVGLAVYSVFSYFTYAHASSTVFPTNISAAMLPFLVGAILVPLSYWSGVTGSLVLGYRPVAGGYSLILGEIAKIVVAYEELFVFKAGLVGVLLALTAAYSVQSLVGTYLSRGAAHERVDLENGRRWFKLAALPALTALPGAVLLSDTFFALLLFGSTVVGHYQSAFLVASVVGYVSVLATPLYTILLRGPNVRAPSVTLDFMLLFAVPMAVGGIVLARPILALFGPTYTSGSAGLQILCLMFLVLSISGLLDQTLTGTERADEEAGANMRRLSRSNLVFVPSVNIISAVTYIVVMVLTLSYATSQGMSDSLRVSLWAAVQLLATLVFMLVKLRRARKVASLSVGRSLAYYLVAAAIMGVVAYLLSRYALSATADALAYAAELGALVAAGAIVYFGTLYLLDGSFRKLMRSFLKML
jgi:O-antigen/teichoic acid export membrane protein